MKRISILLFAILLAFTSANAQNVVSVSGTVTNTAGSAVPNVPVYIVDSLSGYFNLVITNPNGFYSDTLTPNNTQGAIIVGTQDCNGPIDQVGFYSPGSQSIVINFANFCDSTIGGGGGLNCYSDFTYSDSAGTVFFYSNVVTGTAPFTYSWDFGDGTTSTLANPTHIYNTPFPPLATLTVTDATGCVSTYSDLVITNSGGGGGGGSGCFAFFLPLQQNGLNYTFLSLGSGGGPFGGAAGTTTSWSFDGGVTYTQTGDSVSYTFPAVGNYTICATVSDSSGCSDTFCQPMYVDTTVIGGGGQGLCYVDYNFTTSNLTATFTSNPPTGTAPFIYHWDFGDGNTSTLANPVHTYSQAGTYIAALSVTDATGCVSYYCLFITVGNAQNCFVSVWNDYVNNLTAGFSAFSSAGAGATFEWSVDGGVTYVAGIDTFSHTFGAAGSYDVCVRVTDANGCVATDCYPVWVGSIPNINVIGFAVANQMPIGDNEGIAYLISHDSIAGTLTLVDSMVVMGGSFYFSNVPAGDYLVKVALLPSSPDYANYLPTYLGDVLFWHQSTPISISPNNMFLPLFIDMVAGSNLGGPGFIGGSVLQGANFQGGVGIAEDEGDPVPNAPVILLDDNDNAIAHTVTDANGVFSFPSVAYGTYQVHVDILDVNAVPFWVTLDASNQTANNTNFVYDTDEGIEPVTSTTSLPQVEGLKLYPNPVREAVRMELDLVENVDMSLVIYNVFGQEVSTTAKSLQAGKQFVTIDVEELPAGTYVINLVADGKFISQKFIKQ